MANTVNKKKSTNRSESDILSERRNPPRNAANKAPVKRKKKAHKNKKKKSSAFGRILRMILLILAVIIVGFACLVILDSKGIVNTGIYEKLNTAIHDISKPAATGAPSKRNEGFSSLYDDDEVNDDGLDLSQGNSISVSNLSITEGLNQDWMNVLLLGADSRNDAEPCRTDTMMICSVNVKTGEVKLTSIMRDTCVSIEGHSATRINSAYFYGGPQLAMKTVNECFGMNIEKYAFVDFNGFASIAEALGGIDVDITKNEMDQINKGVYEQYHVLIKQGRMDYDAAADEFYATLLDRYGSDIHLNGMQTLGYARIRKIDSDYARTERQRRVLNLMLEKLKGSDLNRIMSLVYGNTQYFRTNLGINDIVEIAKTVLSNTSSMSAAEMRLPINGTYKEEKRNNEAMLYDTDFKANTLELHAFIYN